MGCCGKHKAAGEEKAPAESIGAVGDRARFSIYPSEGCVMCAEKHLSTALALAGEAGYITPNRQRIIGELTACALHLYKDNADMAEKVRAMRHLIQKRREAEVDWTPMLAEIDGMAAAEAKKLLEEQTNKKEA